MKSAETRAMRKALAGMIGFLARGAATRDFADQPPDSHLIGLVRGDGAKRQVDPALLKAALSRGLITRRTGPGTRTSTIAITDAGRAALRRLIADPDSAFQDQHRQMVARTDQEFGAVTVNVLESPLSALARIKGRDGTPFLSEDLVEAGERLRADFTRGQMTPSLGQRWEPVRAGRMSGQAGGVQDLTDAALSARQRVEAATGAIGPELSGVVLDACCFLKGLSQIERERQWPVRSAKLMLRTALQALARHYQTPRSNIETSRRAPPPHAP